MYREGKGMGIGQLISLASVNKMNSIQQCKAKRTKSSPRSFAQGCALPGLGPNAVLPAVL